MRRLSLFSLHSLSISHCEGVLHLRTNDHQESDKMPFMRGGFLCRLGLFPTSDDCRQLVFYIVTMIGFGNPYDDSQQWYIVILKCHRDVREDC